MKRISSIIGGTIAAATMVALLAPAAGAATTNQKHSDKGTLRVCTIGNGSEADIDVDGPSNKDADLENKECATWLVKKGTYTVSQDESDRNKVARTVVRGPGRSWDTSRDNEVKVDVRSGQTTTVVFMNERNRGRGFDCFWCHDND